MGNYEEEVCLDLSHVYCTIRSLKSGARFEIEFEPEAHKWLTDPTMGYADDRVVLPLGDIHVAYLHKKLDEYIEKIKQKGSA